MEQENEQERNVLLTPLSKTQISVTAVVGTLTLAAVFLVNFQNNSDTQTAAVPITKTLQAPGLADSKVSKLFTERKDVTPVFDTLSEKKGKGTEKRSVDVKDGLLEKSAEIELNLLDSVNLIAKRDRIEIINGGTTWIGHIEGDENDRVYLTMRHGVASGVVHWGERSFELVYTKSGTHAVREIDPDYSLLYPLDDAVEVPFDPDTDTVSDTENTPLASAEAGDAVIDIMVVYTQQAQNAAGGAAGIESRILTAVAETNDAYLRSQIPVQVNLVHTSLVNHTESGDYSTELSRLKSTSDGYLDEVHALRDQYAADQVVLIEGGGNYCGIGYSMTSGWVNSGFATYAFSVVKLSCATGYYSFGHEMGHNQGLQHDVANGSNGGAYSYSYGYTDCSSFRTVMSYSCGGAPRVRNFSNPDVLYGSKPTGTAGADNARTLAQTSALVASFRSAPATTVPAAASNLQASVYSDSQIGLSWTDNADDESGYDVERSLDGSSWSVVARLGKNTTSYTDVGLTQDTNYYYRIKAYNSVGYSPSSNVAQVRTDAKVVDIIDPVVTIVRPADGSSVPKKGSLGIDVSATDDQNVARVEIAVNGSVIGACANSNTCTASINVKRLKGSTHTVVATAWDGADNTAQEVITLTSGTVDDGGGSDDGGSTGTCNPGQAKKGLCTM